MSELPKRTIRNFKGEAIEATITDLPAPKDYGHAVESLDEVIRAKFQGKSDAYLIRRMEQASDFGYDDESYELTRRLAINGLSWRWKQIQGKDKVEIYKAEGGEDA